MPLAALCLGVACGTEHGTPESPDAGGPGGGSAASNPERPSAGETASGGWGHGLGGPEDDTATGVAVGRDGDVVTVVSGTPRQDEDRAPVPGERLVVSLARYAADGTRRWLREFPRERLAELRVAASPGADGSMFLSGNAFLYPADFGLGATNDGFVVRFDAEGKARWQRRVGQKAWSVAADGTGGVVVAAEEWEGEEVQDPVLTRLDADGSVRWTRRFPGTGEETALRAVTLTPSGRTVWAGQLSDTLEVDGRTFGAKGRRGFVVLAFDDAGKLVWGKELPGAKGRVTSVSSGPDGAVSVVGDFTGLLVWDGASLGSSGPFLLRVGAEGEELGLRQPACGEVMALGPSVAVDDEGGATVVCGDVLSRYTPDGTWRDDRTVPPVGCASGTCSLAATGIAAEPQGGVVVAGWQRDGTGDTWNQDGFVRRVVPQ
ncbi:hypothetical protein LZ198_17175 [Myxococcus sp. K15C18031901]|uniref:hypothetical protein n=1 Tax=Myxococcus dinghuensis TaxID=2906761 RepID=UPI0020A74518|nr:hypothetical protein [Myxococcus dinghuensis]MCP3100605.1 hypothetical protein [Myxococcus dinghuensis]